MPASITTVAPAAAPGPVSAPLSVAGSLAEVSVFAAKNSTRRTKPQPASASTLTQLKAQIQHAQARLIEVPQIRQVAVLLDNQQHRHAVTYNPKAGALLVQQLNEVKEGREDSMQVWAIAGDAAPRSLGVVTSKYKTMHMPVREADLQGVTEIAVSAENKGGVATGMAPSLPWLFKGWLAQKSI